MEVQFQENFTADDLRVIIKKMQAQIVKLEAVLDESKEVLTLDEAAVLLGVTQGQMYKLTYKHYIPFFRSGKYAYFERSELMAWVCQNPIVLDERRDLSQVV